MSIIETAIFSPANLALVLMLRLVNPAARSSTVTARSLICVAEKDGKFQFRWDRPSTFYAPQAGSWCEATGGHNVSTPFYCDGMLGAFNIHVSGGVIRLAAGADGTVTANQIWDSNTLWPKARAAGPTQSCCESRVCSV